MKTNIKKVKISVIVPLYNSSSYFMDAINSIYEQGLYNFEVILVDDGSEFIEHNIYLEKIKNLKEVILSRKKNGGAASARNHGVKLSSGDYIAFLDSDDAWLPGKLESQIDIIIKNKAKIVLGNVIVSDGDLLPIYKHDKNSSNIKPNERMKLIRGFYYGQIVMNTPTIIIERDVFFQVGGFCEQLKYREDHYFLMKVAKIVDVYIDANYLTKRRERTASLSQIGSFDDELDKHIPFWELCDEDFSELTDIHKAKLNLSVRLMFAYIKRDNYTQAISAYKAIKAQNMWWGYLLKLPMVLAPLFRLLISFREVLRSAFNKVK